MNQSELIEKVVQATELNQAVAGHAVKSVVNAILDALLAGEAVRVSGLGIFNVAARPARRGRNPQTGETIEIAASKVVRFHAGIQHGISVAQIYRAGNNPLLDRMIARFRGDAGELIPKGTVAARRAIAALRQGTHLTLLADQKMNDGIPVPFFGRPAMTAPALAVLALRFDCDVLPARVERLDGARFRLTVFPPLPLPRSGEPRADAAALMARVNAILEAWIRDRPEQWLWVHRRWPD
jgi:nucleoid DNA-binding protein